MILDNQWIIQRYVNCDESRHRFNENAQRELFLQALSRGAALVSPDELSYFRSGCALDSNEERMIYNGLFGHLTSVLLLAEHHLLGTYHGLHSIKEACLQIAVSIVYLIYQVLNTLLSTLALALSLSYMLALGPLCGYSSTFAVGDSFVIWCSNIVKTCSAAVLLITGIIGALVTRPLSSLVNPAELKRDQDDDVQVQTAKNAIVCHDDKIIKNAFFWQKPKHGTGSRLERVVGSLSEIMNECPELASTQLPYTCDCSYYGKGM